VANIHFALAMPLAKCIISQFASIWATDDRESKY